jgi:hypothetical protein
MPDALSADQTAALAGVLDLLIPASSDGHMPGAGEAGVATRIAATAARDAGFAAGVAAGLAALDAEARTRGASGFVALAAADRLAALQAIASAQPGFVPSLIFHTYAGYYQEGRVLEALGLEARPPFPKGYTMEPFDESLLARVKRRGKLYRDA